jgi:type II secretory pathway component PulF
MEQAARRPSLVVALVVLGAALHLWAALVAELLMVVPAYEGRLRAYQAKLPYATELVLNTSRWTVRYWYVLALAGLPLLVASAAVTYILRQPAIPRWPGVIWFAWLLGLPLIAQIILWVGVLVPLTGW